jgi:hypothetical protein
VKPGSVVVVHLHSPREKVWGVLLTLSGSGITVKAIDLSSFEDWTRQVARGEESIGLSTIFYPMHRVERVELDETVGGIASCRDTFEQRTGKDLFRYLKVSQSGRTRSAPVLQFPSSSQGQAQNPRGKASRKKPGR